VISIRPFTREDLPLYYEWAKIPHVRDTWFLEGYEGVDAIEGKIRPGGYDFPFIILLDKEPIGYIQYSDLFAYRTQCEDRKGVFTDEEQGTYCLDLFLATHLGKGYGTEAVKEFCAWMKKHLPVKQILISPSVENKRAIRCYEKVGFQRIREAEDGVEKVVILRLE